MMASGMRSVASCSFSMSTRIASEGNFNLSSDGRPCFPVGDSPDFVSLPGALPSVILASLPGAFGSCFDSTFWFCAHRGNSAKVNSAAVTKRRDISRISQIESLGLSCREKLLLIITDGFRIPRAECLDCRGYDADCACRAGRAGRTCGTAMLDLIQWSTTQNSPDDDDSRLRAIFCTETLRCVTTGLRFLTPKCRPPPRRCFSMR